MIEAEDVDMEEDHENENGAEHINEEEKDEEMEDEGDYDDEDCDDEDNHRGNDMTTIQPLNAQHLHNSHLYKRGPTKYQKASSDYYGSNSKGHWTKEEDMALAEAVKKNQGKNWKKIAETLPGRTDV